MTSSMPDIAEIWSKPMTEDEVKASLEKQKISASRDGKEPYYPDIKCPECGSVLKPDTTSNEKHVYYECKHNSECDNCKEAVCDFCVVSELECTRCPGSLTFNRCFGSYQGTREPGSEADCSLDPLDICENPEVCRNISR